MYNEQTLQKPEATHSDSEHVVVLPDKNRVSCVRGFEDVTDTTLTLDSQQRSRQNDSSKEASTVLRQTKKATQTYRQTQECYKKESKATVQTGRPSKYRSH